MRMDMKHKAGSTRSTQPESEVRVVAGGVETIISDL